MQPDASITLTRCLATGGALHVCACQPRWMGEGEDLWIDYSCQREQKVEFVAVDALLSDEAMITAGNAMEFFVEDQSKPVHERDIASARAGTQAAVNCVRTAERATSVPRSGESDAF